LRRRQVHLQGSVWPGGGPRLQRHSRALSRVPLPLAGGGTAVQGVASLNRLVAGHEGRRVRRPDRGNAVMALKTNTCAAATAVAAAFSLLATPAAAIELPKPLAVDAFDGEGWNAERDRRRRWDRGRYRHRNGIDAGDVVAGVLVIGAIAAIAGAGKDRRDRTDNRYPDDDGYGYRAPGSYDRSDGRGIDSAVDICVSEAER